MKVLRITGKARLWLGLLVLTAVVAGCGLRDALNGPVPSPTTPTPVVGTASAVPATPAPTMARESSPTPTPQESDPRPTPAAQTPTSTPPVTTSTRGVTDATATAVRSVSSATAAPSGTLAPVIPSPTRTAVPSATPAPTRTSPPTATRPLPPTPTPTISGWRGEYYSNRVLAGAPLLVRDDASLDMDWGRGSPGAGLPADDFSARWTRILPFDAGLYRFHATVDDGLRLYVNGELVIDAWRDGARREVMAERRLVAGNYSLRVEYYERSVDALVHVWWEKVMSFANWKAEYWPNRRLDGSPVLVRDDASVDFNWRTAAPGPGVPADNFSVRWSRDVSFDRGLYRFYARADDGIRVYVDDQRILDEWQDSNADTVYTVERSLSGRRRVVVEYYERGGAARVEFWWQRVSATATPKPLPGVTVLPTWTPITLTPTFTPTPSSTPVPPTQTPITLTPTFTPAPPTPTAAATRTATLAPPPSSATPTLTPALPTPTFTPTTVPTDTPVPAPSATPTESPVPTDIPITVAAPTWTPTMAPTESPVPTDIPITVAAPTWTRSATSVPAATSTTTAAPTATAILITTATVTGTLTIGLPAGAGGLPLDLPTPARGGVVP